MARILYGVQGDAHGHAIRALTIARRFPQHKFMFVSYDHGARLIRREFQVFDAASLETVVKNHRLAPLQTLYSNLQFFRRERRLMGGILKLIDDFKPDVAITDYEYFVPRACRRSGLPCLSLDHQHIITFCSHQVPSSQLSSYLATYMAVRCLFSAASKFVATSFFRPPLKDTSTDVKIVPPIFRERVSQIHPTIGDHVLAYRSHSPSDGFIPFLKSIRRPVTVYGFNLDRRDGNLQFKSHSEEGFLEDLASCSYVVCGGGHTLISEALYYGKPVLSFPIADLFEQFLNGFYLQKLGYGLYLTKYGLDRNIVPSFESRLDEFRRAIAEDDFFGNQEVFSLVDHFIRQGEPILRRP